MSLQLATKGTLNGGVTHATKGMIYLAGGIEWIISILPNFITRRVAVDKIVRRVEVTKIFRREND